MDFGLQDIKAQKKMTFRSSSVCEGLIGDPRATAGYKGKVWSQKFRHWEHIHQIGASLIRARKDLGAELKVPGKASELTNISKYQQGIAASLFSDYYCRIFIQCIPTTSLSNGAAASPFTRLARFKKCQFVKECKYIQLESRGTVSFSLIWITN